MRPRHVDQVIFERDLGRITRNLEDRTRIALFDLLEALEPEYMRDTAVRDGFGDELRAALGALKQEFSDLDAYAQAKSEGLIDRMDKAHARRFFEKLKDTAGVDLAGVVERERLDEVLRAKVHENVELIKSIPDEYFGKLERMVYENTVQGRTTAAGLQAKIADLWDVTSHRAKFIARDQTAKLNSAINTERNLAAGIVEYEWRATGGKSGDGRTRASHSAKHENIYRFDQPPADTGHPGEDFQCRCTARSIIPGAN
ncbi:MAG: minor capsid protein [Planctomycetota bacterium]|nr:minor capsid protein [Planctomycetota bacterium]